MGHRALIAYRRSDGLFNLHYSHWGAHDLKLEHRITAETPFGGDDDMGPPVEALQAFTDALQEAADADDADVSGRLADDDGDDGPNRAVNPAPMETGASMLDMMETLDDAWFEALYVVTVAADEHAGPGPISADDVSLDVTGFVVFRDLQGDYLLLHPDGGLGYERGWVRGQKDAHERLTDDGTHLGRDGGISERAANERFLTAVLDRYEDQLSDWVLAWSPAIGPDLLEAHPGAFFKTSGRHRVLGEMYPSNPLAPDWAIPPDFPSVKTADGERVDLSG